MVKKEIKNMSESVRAKLKNISRETKRDFDAVLLQYFQERFLYRISISEFRKNLILKGALLLMVKSLSPFRLTKDIDFMGIGIAGKPENIESIFKNIADINYDDGVHFASESIEATIIKEGAEYQGVRIKLEATMGSIRKSGCGQRVLFFHPNESLPALFSPSSLLNLSTSQLLYLSYGNLSPRSSSSRC